MSQKPLIPRPPRIPLSERAEQNLALNALSAAIFAIDDGDEPINKLMHLIHHLEKISMVLNVDLTPVHAPVFTRTLAGIANSVAIPSSSNVDPTLAASIQKRSRAAPLFQDIIDKYNPDGLEPSVEPSEFKFMVTDNRPIAAQPATKTVSTSFRQLKKQVSAKVVSNKLPAIQIAYSADVSIAVVTSLRERFFAAMEEASFPPTKNKSTVEIKFEKVEIQAMTDLIFNRIFGLGGLKHVMSLVNSYEESMDEDAPVASTRRAATLSLMSGHPSQLKGFYHAYHEVSKDERECFVPLKQLSKLFDKHKLYSTYVQLTTTRTTHLRQLMEEAGITTSQGRGWGSAMLTYLAQELMISTQKLQKTLQLAQPIYLLAETFGVGILALVTSTIAASLDRFGSLKLRKTLSIADEITVPHVKPICDTVESHVLNPLIGGGDVFNIRMRVDAELSSFLDAFQIVEGEHEVNQQEFHDNVEIEIEDSGDQGQQQKEKLEGGSDGMEIDTSAADFDYSHFNSDGDETN